MEEIVVKKNLVFIGLLICILFLLIGCTTPSIDLTPEEEINALIDKFGEGFAEEDVDKVLSCCHFPFLIYHYDWDSAYQHTLSSYQTNLEKMFTEHDMYIDEFINRDITFISISEAIVHATEHWEGDDNESGYIIGYEKVQLTCIKEGGSWKISKYIFLEDE